MFALRFGETEHKCKYWSLGKVLDSLRTRFLLRVFLLFCIFVHYSSVIVKFVVNFGWGRVKNPADSWPLDAYPAVRIKTTF